MFILENWHFVGHHLEGEVVDHDFYPAHSFVATSKITEVVLGQDHVCFETASGSLYFCYYYAHKRLENGSHNPDLDLLERGDLLSEQEIDILRERITASQVHVYEEKANDKKSLLKEKKAVLITFNDQKDHMFESLSIIRKNNPIYSENCTIRMGMFDDWVIIGPTSYHDFSYKIEEGRISFITTTSKYGPLFVLNEGLDEIIVHIGNRDMVLPPRVIRRAL